MRNQTGKADRGWPGQPAGRMAAPWRSVVMALAMGAASVLGGTEAEAQDQTGGITQSEKDALHPPNPFEPRGTCSGNGLGLFYPFNAANTTGWTLALARGDDNSSVQINLGFTFVLYGVNHTSCFINNNGNITFGSAFGDYTPSGFPSAAVPPMIAPFWADVDTRNTATGRVWYKIIDSNNGGLPDTLIVTWDNVGYFNSHADLLDTFQMVITNFTNPLFPTGANVCFDYDNMCWTTGDIEGSGGFTNPPSPTTGNATVGINQGNGSGYFQIGRFGENNSTYDGPFGGADGVNYLDNRRFFFNTQSGNVPPIAASVPTNNTYTVQAGQVLNQQIQFLSPEVGQTTTITTLDQDGAVADGLVMTVTNGNLARLDFDWTTGCSDVGSYTIIVTARDSFNPQGTTVVNITINVTEVNSQPTLNITSPAAFSGHCTTVNIVGTATSNNPALFGSYTLAYANDPDGPFTTFATNATEVSNGVLGVWNTAALAPGYYFIRLRGANICGVSRDYTTVLAKCGPPTIAAQPVAQSATEGGRICLRVHDGTFCGSGYQWQRNGVNVVNNARIAGATSDELMISPVLRTDAGSYRCILTNSCGSVISAAVPVTVRCRADFNDDGQINVTDYLAFLNAYSAGCP
jgi:hypothetical protein